MSEEAEGREEETVCCRVGDLRGENTEGVVEEEDSGERNSEAGDGVGFSLGPVSVASEQSSGAEVGELRTVRSGEESTGSS